MEEWDVPRKRHLHLYLRNSDRGHLGEGQISQAIYRSRNCTVERNWTGRTLGRYFRPIASLGIKAPKKKKAKRHGYDEFRQLLLKELTTFKKPTLLMHGDNHLVKMDKPLWDPKSKRFVSNFTRVETFGNPTTGWIHVKVDPKDPDLFTFNPRMYRAN